MLQYLLDTNVISEPAYDLPNIQVLERIKLNQWHISISAITWHELVFGVERLPKSKKKDRLSYYVYESVFDSIKILEYDSKAARLHAVERSRLQKIGVQTSFADGQIASIAESNNLILVTRNTKDFSAFTNLKLENWFEA